MKNKEETLCEQPNVQVVHDCKQSVSDTVIRGVARFYLIFLVAISTNPIPTKSETFIVPRSPSVR